MFGCGWLWRTGWPVGRAGLQSQVVVLRYSGVLRSSTMVCGPIEVPGHEEAAVPTLWARLRRLAEPRET